MPDLNEEVQFELGEGCIKFTTHKDGDIIIINEISICCEKAASLAWLVNQPGKLVVEIKRVV